MPGRELPLLPREVHAIDRYLADGGNALFMLDPFIRTGLEPIVEEFGVVLDDTMVIDSASHFWTDVSAPAVTDYNRAEITGDLPLTFFPGARSLSPTSPTGARRLGQADSSTPRRRASQAPTARSRIQLRPKDKPGPVTMMVVAIRKPEFVAPAEAVLRDLRGEKPAADAGPEGRKFAANRAWRSSATPTSPPTRSFTSWATERCS